MRVETRLDVQCPVSADAMHIQQMVFNLITNALPAAPARETVASRQVGGSQAHDLTDQIVDLHRQPFQWRLLGKGTKRRALSERMSSNP